VVVGWSGLAGRHSPREESSGAAIFFVFRARRRKGRAR
jgi:hypothetical protein